MPTTIKWSKSSGKDLDRIYYFYLEKSKSEIVASKIYNDLIDAAEPLKTFPLMAPKEKLLAGASKDYHSLVVCKYFKIIYYLKGDFVHSAAVWDCRQSTKRLIQLFRH